MKINKKGISLIVLIITVIVMIILSAAIIITLANNGIIGKANEAVEEMNEAEMKEMVTFAWADAFLKDTNEIKDDDWYYNEVINYLKANGITQEVIDQYTIIATQQGADAIFNGNLARLNEHGFYYNMLYKTTIEGVTGGIVFLENNTMLIYVNINEMTGLNITPEKFMHTGYEEGYTYEYLTATIKNDRRAAAPASELQKFEFEQGGKQVTLTIDEWGYFPVGTTFTLDESQGTVREISLEKTYKGISSDIEYSFFCNGTDVILTFGADSETMSKEDFGLNNGYCWGLAFDGTVLYLDVDGNEIVPLLCSNANNEQEELKTLFAPTITKNGNTLLITDNAANRNYTEAFEIYVGNEKKATVTKMNITAFDLTTLNLEDGIYNITVKAIATGITTSVASKTVQLELPIPGLYRTGSNYTELISDWDELIREGIITVDGKAEYDKISSLSGDLLISSTITTLVNNSYSNWNGLTGVIVPKSVTSIGNGAFYSCNNLTSITLPNSVTSIGSSAFYSCDKLTNVTLPNSVTTIANMAFYESGIETITMPGVTSIGEEAFSRSKLTSLTIPGGVTSIGKEAFSYCNSLSSVVYQEGVKTTGEKVFAYCNALASVTIPSSMLNIRNDAFTGCKALSSVTFSANSQLKTIEKNAFYACFALKSIAIPNSVTSIGNWAFCYCIGLESIVIPNGVTNIGVNVFSDCTNLKSVTIPNSVSIIDSGAFSYCSNLEEVTIPSSVLIVKSSAFAASSSLATIVYSGTKEQWETIQKEIDWAANILATKVICTDGTVCITHTVPNGICAECGKHITTIETEHSPYQKDQNHVVLGTWDYSDAKSVTITITYNTDGAQSDWVSVAEGTNYVYGSYRYYLNTSGTKSYDLGDSTVVKFGGTKTVKEFRNIDMLTGSVVFTSDTRFNSYYGAKVEIVANY